MATDKTAPGTGTPEDAKPKELTIAGVSALRDRYLSARKLEDSGYFHIGSIDGRSFAQFSSTPERDAWTLTVVTPGLKGPTRHELGIRPDRDNGLLTPYALIKTQGEEPMLGCEAETAFETYLDKKYPEPEKEGTPDGHAPSSEIVGITQERIGIIPLGPDDADGISTARAAIKV